MDAHTSRPAPGWNKHRNPIRRDSLATAPSLGGPRTQGTLRRLGLVGLALAIASLLLAPLSAGAATVGLRQAGTGLTTVQAATGVLISFELFLDTDGFDFQGYNLGIDFTGGSVSSLSVTHQSLAGMFEFFGTSVIDNGAGTVRNINQASLSGSLLNGIYVLDTIGVTVGAFGGGNEFVLTPGLFGEVLGLGGGSCPGTTPGCSVTFSSASITAVPEPHTALLFGMGLMILGVRQRRQISG